MPHADGRFGAMMSVSLTNEVRLTVPSAVSITLPPLILTCLGPSDV